jgi:hypothetical protein
MKSPLPLSISNLNKASFYIYHIYHEEHHEKNMSLLRRSVAIKDFRFLLMSCVFFEFFDMVIYFIILSQCYTFIKNISSTKFRMEI